MDITLPEALFADVAPLPIPMAEHLFRSWTNRSSKHQQDGLAAFLEELQEKRRYVYTYMDSFVRNRDRDQSPHRLRYSTQWLRENLGQYTPSKQPIPSKTFNQWVANGFIRNTKKGQPTPDSGAAIYIMRMMLEGTRLLYDSLPEDVAPWVCYAQDSPESQRYCVPITEIERVPHTSTILWTPWAGAAWDSSWMLLANAPEGKYFGAIRFAHVEIIHGEIHYTISKDDILSWVPQFAPLFKDGPFQTDTLQRVARVALTFLAEGRVPSY